MSEPAGSRGTAPARLYPTPSACPTAPSRPALPCREALQYIRLREDFPYARVEGKSLQDLFGGDGAGKDQVLGGTANAAKK